MERSHLRCRGLFPRLPQHAIEQVRSVGAKSRFLGSNTRLRERSLQMNSNASRMRDFAI
jgi:hypothetical protein